MEVFKKGIKSFIFHISGSAFAITLQFFAARLLGPEQYGRANYILGYASSISIIFSFGISFYFPKVFQEKENPRKVLSGIFYSTSIFYIFFFLLFLLFYRNPILVKIDYLLLFVVSWFLFLLGYLKSYLIGNHLADEASKLGNFYLRLAGLILFPLLVLVFGENYMAFIISLIISHVLILLPFYKKNLIITVPDFSFIKKALFFYLIQLFYSFFNEFAKVLQGDFIGVKSVALLSISLVIGGIITIFGENFANVGLPIFANALKEGNVKMMKIKFQEIARINVIFVLPLFFMVTFNSQGILGLFGEEYKSGNVILILILLGSFVNSFTGPNGSLLLMSGKEKLELLNGIIKFIIAIAVAIIFGRKYTWGIALGLALGEVVVNLLKCFEVFFFYRILPLQKKEAIYLFFIICLEAIMFGALKMFDLPVILNLAAGLMIIVISWTVTLLGSPNESDRAIFYFFKNRVWNLFLFRI